MKETLMKILRILAALGIGVVLLPLTAEVTTVSMDNYTFHLDPATCSDAAPYDITGTFKGITLVHTTTSSNGRVHIGVVYNGNGTGTDQYGGRWIFTDADNYFSFNGFLPPPCDPLNGVLPSACAPLEFTHTDNFHLISQGNTKNITTHVIMHIKIDSTGKVTVDFNKLRGGDPAICEPAITLIP
jgi:hypothetical protein